MLSSLLFIAILFWRALLASTENGQAQFNETKSGWFSRETIQNHWDTSYEFHVKPPQQVAENVEHLVDEHRAIIPPNIHRVLMFSKSNWIPFSTRNLIRENPSIWNCKDCTDTHPKPPVKLEQETAAEPSSSVSEIEKNENEPVEPVPTERKNEAEPIVSNDDFLLVLEEDEVTLLPDQQKSNDSVAISEKEVTVSTEQANNTQETVDEEFIITEEEPLSPEVSPQQTIATESPVVVEEEPQEQAVPVEITETTLTEEKEASATAESSQLQAEEYLHPVHIEILKEETIILEKEEQVQQVEQQSVEIETTVVPGEEIISRRTEEASAVIITEDNKVEEEKEQEKDSTNVISQKETSKEVIEETPQGISFSGFLLGFFVAVTILLISFLCLHYYQQLPGKFLIWFEKETSKLFEDRNYPQLIQFITTHLPKAIYYFTNHHSTIQRIQHILAKAYYKTLDHRNSLLILESLSQDYLLFYGEDFLLAEIYEDQGLNYALLELYPESLHSLHQSLRIYLEELQAQPEKYQLMRNDLISVTSECNTDQESPVKKMIPSDFSTGKKSLNFSEDSNLFTEGEEENEEEAETFVQAGNLENNNLTTADDNLNTEELTPTVKLHPVASQNETNNAHDNSNNVTNGHTSPNKQKEENGNNHENSRLSIHRFSTSSYRLENIFGNESDCLMALKELEEMIDSGKQSPYHFHHSHLHQLHDMTQTSSSILSPSSSLFSIPYYSDLLLCAHPAIIRVTKELADVYYQTENYEQSLIFYCNCYVLLILMNYAQESAERREVFGLIVKNKKILDLSMTLAEEEENENEEEDEDSVEGSRFLEKNSKQRSEARDKINRGNTREENQEEEEINVDFLPREKDEIQLSSLKYYDVYHIL
jgi:hypothetical protein